MRDYSEPNLTCGIGKLNFCWPDLEMLVIADRITDSSRAELWFYHQNGDGNKLLEISRIDLFSTSGKNTLARKLGVEQDKDYPWSQMLTYISKVTIESQRAGEPAGLIKPTTQDIKHPGYFVEPLVMKGVPSIIFGDKGVAKTTLSLLAIGLIATGDHYNSCGLIASQARVGMLDWESSQELTDYTVSRLVESGSIGYFELPYLRCKHSLANDLQRIANFVNDNGIEVLLIDSLGQAAGSIKYDSSGKEAALNFFEALGQLNVTSLIIAQNSKGDTGQKTIYGSTYFTYYARNIFELRDAQMTVNPLEKIVGLIHTEGNYSKKYDPIGFKISYSDTEILVEPQNVTLSQLKDKVDNSMAILDFLRISGALQSVSSIADAVGISENNTRVTLSALKKKGKVVNPQKGLWGAAYED